MIAEAIKQLVEGRDLSKELCEQVAREIMAGDISEAQLGAFLTALRIKGETSEELTGFAKIMREFCNKINPKVKGTLVDICGTGGDKLKTFNISTASSFVIAGAGIPVAKHGNRSVTSKCGSADILEALGANLNLNPKQVEMTIEKIGIGFMFAPLFHPAMKNVQSVRRTLGIRTIFNLLGPLTNPANAKAQVIGVHSKELVCKIGEVLRDLGVERGLVVYGSGMDELSTLDFTNVAELKNGEIEEYIIDPKELGIKRSNLSDLYAEDVEASVKSFKEALEGKDEAKLDIVLLNSAAGIMVGGKAGTIEEGIEIAREVVKSGEAIKKLEQLVQETRRDET